jgi:hypothetical protein
MPLSDDAIDETLGLALWLAATLDPPCDPSAPIYRWPSLAGSPGPSPLAHNARVLRDLVSIIDDLRGNA